MDEFRVISKSETYGEQGEEQSAQRSRLRIWVVGPGFHFLGGLSVYSCRLANALAADHEVSVVLLQKLIPARLYPGGARAGQDLTSLAYDERVRVVGNVDWYWGNEIRRVARLLKRERPDVLLLQWWTGATLHTYLALTIAARHAKVPVIIEFHEAQDTGEASVPLAGVYCRRILPVLLGRTAGALLHNQHDHELLRHTYGRTFDRLVVDFAPHGPYDHFPMDRRDLEVGPKGSVTSLLFFGLIRPYKGLEDLIKAFNALTSRQAEGFSLTVVGETWEGWTLPSKLISASPHRNRITFINRYVSDAEAGQFFGQADALVLPYRRGSASGPLQIAMSVGIHVLMYEVGGLVEAVQDYKGAVLIPPDNVDALRCALLDLPSRRADRFPNPHSWAATSAAIGRLATAVSATDAIRNPQATQ